MCLPELLLRLLLVLALIRVWLAELLADAVRQLEAGVEGVDLLLVAVAGLRVDEPQQELSLFAAERIVERIVGCPRLVL